MGREWSLRAAEAGDREAIAELRAVVLRADLERLGRFDEHRVRQRFRDAFVPEHTLVIEVDRAFAGSVALRPADDCTWLEHLYLEPRLQGHGIGASVIREILTTTVGSVRLIVLQGSPARRLYERLGFAVIDDGPIDVLMERAEPTDG